MEPSAPIAAAFALVDFGTTNVTGLPELSPPPVCGHHNEGPRQ